MQNWQTHIRAQPESAPQLAAMLGVSRATVDSWRCGRRAPPPTEQAAILRRLAERRADSARVAQVVAELWAARDVGAACDAALRAIEAGPASDA